MTKAVSKKDLIKPFIKLIISLSITLLLTIFLFTITAGAESSLTDSSSAVIHDSENSGILDGILDPNDNNGTLELILLITILSLAPSIIILMTSFTRIIIVFSLLRNAMGIQQTPPNQVLVGLALFLTFFIMSPVIKEMNDIAYKPYKNGELSTVEAMGKASEPLKKFMLKQTSNESMEFFLDLADKEMPDEANITKELGLEIVVPAFILSELKIAFTIGFLLYVTT